MHTAPLPAKKLYSLSRLNLHQTNHTTPLPAGEGQGVGLFGLLVASFYLITSLVIPSSANVSCATCCKSATVRASIRLHRAVTSFFHP